jgi:hypothetical protein
MSQTEISPFDTYVVTYNAVSDIERRPLPNDTRCFDELVLSPDVILASARLVTDATKRVETIERMTPSLSQREIASALQWHADSLETLQIAAARYCLAANGIEVGISPEARPPKAVIITVDPQCNIQVNGSEPQSLNRELGRVSPTARLTQIEGKRLQIAALKVLAANPAKSYSRLELWRELFPGQPIHGETWETHFKPFLHNPPTYHNEPLIEAVRVNRQKNRYMAGNFSMSFTETDKVMDVKQEAIFTFDNGREVSGKAAAILTRLLKATADSPLMLEDIEDLYTPEEIDALAIPNRKLLSNWVNGLNRWYFKSGNTEYEIVPIKTKKVNPETGLEQSGYYMQKRFSLADASHVAHFLKMHEAVLADRKVAPLPDRTSQDIAHAVKASGSPAASSEEVRTVRREAFGKVMELLNNEKRFNAFIKRCQGEDPADPRIALLFHLRDNLTPEGSAAVRRMLSEPHTKVRRFYESSNKGGGVMLVDPNKKDRLAS